jgi:hypothetical protein
MNNIRLPEKDLNNIIASFKACFNEDDHLWIFGSRVYPEKRGGDIDLYIEPKIYESEIVNKARGEFWNMMQDKLGEQKIDIVIKSPSLDLLIYKVAREEGIQLV